MLHAKTQLKLQKKNFKKNSYFPKPEMKLFHNFHFLREKFNFIVVYKRMKDIFTIYPAQI